MAKRKTEDTELMVSAMNHFSLPDKRVVLKFYPRPTAMVTDPSHILYGGMGPQATRYFQLPIHTTGGYMNPFESTEEREYLEEALGLAKNALSPSRRAGNFFDEYTIALTKSDKVLDLSDPEDYLFYLVAKMQKDHIAKDVRSVRGRATYHWYFMDEKEERQIDAVRISNTAKAWMEYGKIEASPDKLRHVLIEYRGGGRLPSAANKIDYLQSEVGKIVGQDPSSFVNIVTDPNLQVKIDIHTAVQKGILNKEKGYYYMEDGTRLSHEGEDNSLEGAIRYLKSPENNEYYLQLKQRIENAGE